MSDSTKLVKQKVATPLSTEQLNEIAKKRSLAARERQAKEQEEQRKKKKEELLAAASQLMLWQEEFRGSPNEIVRSALFTAKNRKVQRENLDRAVVALVGDGEIQYTGKELRQDDETVWMQLIHMARDNGLATEFSFTPRSFCLGIDSSISGQKYDGLEEIMTRLQATSLKIKSKRLGNEVSLSMLPFFKARRKKDGDGGLWTVRMHEELIFLFDDKQFTRVGWEQRLKLPGGLATWLHAYYASHRTPYPVLVETIAIGSGLLPGELAADASEAERSERKARLRGIKKTVKAALTALVKVGFLSSYEIDRKGKVSVVRARSQGDEQSG